MARVRNTGAATSDGEPRPNEQTETETEQAVTIAAHQLRAFLERIERLMEERDTINEDIREIIAEAKGTGFDAPTIRTLVRIRRMDPTRRQEKEAMLGLYKAAIGMG